MSYLGLAIRVCVIFFAYTGLAADTKPISPPNDNGSQVWDVHRFLEESPSLIKIVYGDDPSTYSFNGKHPTGFVYHEASWQPPSFYVRNLTNNLPNFPSHWRMVGRSSDNTPWVLDQSGPIEVLFLNAKDNNDPERAVAIQGVDDALGRLQAARWLWIHPFVRPGSFRWLGTNHFEAKVDIPVQVVTPHEADCTLSGRIVAWDVKGRPTRIEYNCSGFPILGDMSVNFYYRTPVGATELPSVVVSTEDILTKFGKYTRIMTNVLEDVEIGIDPKMSSKGYVPGLFLNSNTPPQVIIASNGVDYTVTGPMWVRTDARPPLKVNLTPKQLIFVHYVFFIIFALSVPIFLILWRKEKGPK